jgi:Tfp pilus assembly protein PilZ
MHDDRRSQQRLDVSLDAVWDGHGNRPARITDLSEGGCFVDTTGEAYIGELLTFRVELPDGQWLELTGEVAHYMRPVGFGLRFVELSDEQREQLLAFLEHLKKPHDPVRAILR